MNQDVFNRYEKKYLLGPDTYRILRQRIEGHMQEDEYGLHTIRNIYYDTKTDELIRNSLEKPVYKEKFRIRCYGEPNRDSKLYLEIKKKYCGFVNKRRVMMRAEDALRYLETGEHPGETCQILKEIDYFLKMHQVEPKLYLAYDRVALYGKEDADFRLTFDKNIRSRWEHLDLSDDSGTQMLLPEGYCLMEAKTKDALPIWLTDILTELNAQSVSFSKYGRIYQEKQMRMKMSHAGQAGQGRPAWECALPGCAGQEVSGQERIQAGCDQQKGAA